MTKNYPHIKESSFTRRTHFTTKMVDFQNTSSSRFVSNSKIQSTSGSSMIIGMQNRRTYKYNEK